MKKLNILIMLLFGIIFFSCEEEEKPLSKTDMLTDGTWELSGVELSPGVDFNSTTITDYYSYMTDCNKDDIYNFNTNGQYTLEEGDTKCDPLSSQIIETGTWVFSSDETILSLTQGSYGYTINIVELSEKTLKVSYQATLTFNSEQSIQTFTETYTHP